jgi:hypothetical protein
MPTPLEYHYPVRRSILASVAAFSLFSGISLARAQINGAPASVTSQNFGGHSTNASSINAPRASVTSLGPNGYAPSNSRVTFSTTTGSLTSDHRRGSDHPHHRHYADGYAAYPYIIGVPVPYAVDPGATDQSLDAEDDADYQGGPTIFDRHGSGADSYVPPVNDIVPAHGEQSANAGPPEPPQEPTLLVFTDGRKLEVGNYAIVGATLFDLTPGHPRKVALADLDLEATRKQNDDRGVIFQLPAAPQGN